MKESGAFVTGKTNHDEFGMGSSSIHSAHGPVINPLRSARLLRQDDMVSEKLSAGGSSGGSAASVKMGLCDIGLATDTGGSTRLPASYCDILGYKPSYGRFSRHGLVAYAESLDCVGLHAQSTSDLLRAFEILDHHDPLDPTSTTEGLRRTSKAEAAQSFSCLPENSTSLQGLRIGVPKVSRDRISRGCSDEQ